MKIEKFTKIASRVMIALIIFALGAMIGPVVEYLISGLEPMIAVNFSIVCAIAAIAASIVYLISIAVENSIVCRRIEAEEAEYCN